MIPNFIDLAGYSAKRIRVQFNSSINALTFLEENISDCYACISVVTDIKFHGKNANDNRFEGAELMNMAWDRLKCVSSCPLGFRINYMVRR